MILAGYASLSGYRRQGATDLPTYERQGAVDLPPQFVRQGAGDLRPGDALDAEASVIVHRFVHKPHTSIIEPFLHRVFCFFSAVFVSDASPSRAWLLNPLLGCKVWEWQIFYDPSAFFCFVRTELQEN